MLNLVRLDKEYTMVPLEVFEVLGWDIPDGGKTVKALAEKAGQEIDNAESKKIFFGDLNGGNWADLV